MAKMADVLKTVTIKLHDDTQLECKDSAEAKNGSVALQGFFAKDILKCVTDEDEYLVPYHAVIWVKVKSETKESEYDDDFCKEAE